MNRLTLFVGLIALALTIVAGSAAQSLCFRGSIAYVSAPMNIRQSYSTDSPVVGSAAAGDSFTVSSSTRGSRLCWLNIPSGWMAWTGRVSANPPGGAPAPTVEQPSAPAIIDNCCFLDRQCQTDQDWTAGYWAYQRNECAANPPASASQPAQAQSPASANIDNCCYLGWNCHTSDQWKNGYHAYQNNQCANPPQFSSANQPIPAGVDNCCHVNQQCASEEDWRRGWAAFKHYQCNVPHPSQGISIQGSPEFVNQVTNALRLLRDRAPDWWKYSSRGLNAIKMIPEGGQSGVWPDTKVYEETLSEVMKDGRDEAGLVYVIFGIVHEACHINEDERYADGLDEEKACMQASLYALQAVNPVEDAGTMAWIQWIIDNIHDPEVQWWN